MTTKMKGENQIKTSEEILSAFEDKFCEKDRSLRTRMIARNGFSMSNGIKQFILEAMRTATEACTLKEQSIEDNDPAENMHEIGWNAAVHAQNDLKSSFFGENKI